MVLGMTRYSSSLGRKARRLILMSLELVPTCAFKSRYRVRREKGGGPQRELNPPGNWFAPPGSNQSSSGGNETAEASGAESR
jgi:hypothetical protein